VEGLSKREDNASLYFGVDDGGSFVMRSVFFFWKDLNWRFGRYIVVDGE
jgi:hypothetical protein